MNVNDRIALELGRAQMGRLIAEGQAEQLRAQVDTLTAELAEAQAKIAALEPSEPAVDS